MPNNTIADNLQRLVNAKNDIADAIVAKGGTVNEGDGLEEFPAAINTIPSGGGERYFKSNVNVTTAPNATVVATRVSFPVKVYAPVGASINITDGYSVFTSVGAGEETGIPFSLPLKGKWSVNVMVTNKTYTSSVIIRDTTEYPIWLGFEKIFGVSWTGGSETTFTYTDDAVNFDNPDPYVNDGNHPGYSPFDNLMPWRGIRRVTIDGNEMVEIPKFWFKVTKTGTAMTFQIATYPADGFSVSPAHMDRDDGVGERDYVYTSRYACGVDYTSKPKQRPRTADYSSGSIKDLGSDFWYFDYAMFWTTRLLYLVEFANWDSQACIGYGGRNANSNDLVITGYTDNMPYHTGTMQSSREVYDSSTQYRYMEGLWDNVSYYCQGISYELPYSSSRYNSHVYVSSKLGGSNAQYIGSRASSGYIKSFSIPSKTGLEWALIPGTVGGSESTYITDYTTGSTENAYDAGVIVGGGNYSGRNYGMFYYQSTIINSFGYRSQYMPSIVW